ncbi:hypothetical protein AXF42_Ash003886 [Apostasia shenzhenica]|uniref:Uncharacterized protein n=1 Tax=Apostasia shenzhenica TaxID=1088818 RepID=A0A2I0AI69_9ASPA|nr:hypothetical protein AXF42_Ash003886 [Apostasia shenzhenica]
MSSSAGRCFLLLLLSILLRRHATTAAPNGDYDKHVQIVQWDQIDIQRNQDRLSRIVELIESLWIYNRNPGEFVILRAKGDGVVSYVEQLVRPAGTPEVTYRLVLTAHRLEPEAVGQRLAPVVMTTTVMRVAGGYNVVVDSAEYVHDNRRPVLEPWSVCFTPPPPHLPTMTARPPPSRLSHCHGHYFTGSHNSGGHHYFGGLR